MITDAMIEENQRQAEADLEKHEQEHGPVVFRKLGKVMYTKRQGCNYLVIPVLKRVLVVRWGGGKECYVTSFGGSR
jgi:hypothetical protein